MTDAMTNQPFLITREQAPSYWQVDSLWSVLASGDTTGGALTAIEQLMPRRSGPPPHVHERLHEYFYLLDGEIRFQIRDQVRTASTGFMVSIPATTPHAFAVVSETSRVLNLYTPGGFTELVTQLGTPATELRLPREGEQQPVGGQQRDGYLQRSAELNTQRLARPDEAVDLLGDERSPAPAR